MTILKPDHVQLAMPPEQEDVARRFYQGVLGLAEVAKPANLAARGGCWFEQDGVKVHLGVDKAFMPTRKAHPAFVVGDYDAVLERCQKGGHAVADDKSLDGTVRAFVDDPFGNRIELIKAAA